MTEKRRYAYTFGMQDYTSESRLLAL